MENHKKIIIYTDGGSRGNPGQAALGVSMHDEKGNILKQFGERMGIKTNNDAEYAAVVAGLKKAKAVFGKDKAKKMEIEVRMDSELVCRQLNGIYKIEKETLWPMFIAVWNLKTDFAKVSFVHVPREQNKEADKMVNQALDGDTQDKLWE